MNISVIVPVYNSEASLPVLVERIKPVLDDHADEYELILINDGSKDGSWEVICDLRERHPWIKSVNLMRNYGQHNAVLCGVREAEYEITVTMDDDLQHPPEEIPKLLTALDKDVDVVYGYPQSERHGFMRDIASRITKLALQTAMGVKTARHVSAFRAFRTQVRDAFASFQSPFVSIDVLLTWGTTRFFALPVRHDARKSGISGYTFRKLVLHALNMLTGFSTVPLQIASLLGFVFMIFGFILFLRVMVGFLYHGGVVPGFTFMASILTIFSGVQLFVLGIIGEYLARIHFRSFNKPNYVIREMKK